jgi:UDP-N-acetyl-2-amino-2-deoxyglucuronate dehydrogenase
MSDEQGRFGIGVIGAGMGAKPHALALQSLAKDIAVLGVYRRDAAQRAAFCSTYGFPEAESYEALLADPRLDAVLVLTPPNAREAIVAAAAKAGKPVLLEKPVERTLEAAERIVALCDAADVTLGVIFQHRFRRASRYLAEAVAENRYGRLEAVHLVVPWWRPQEGYYDQPGRGTFAQDGGGVLITQAIHSLDLMLSLCGEVSAVTAMAKTTRLHQMETEDFVSAGLEFANGAVGAVMAEGQRHADGRQSDDPHHGRRDDHRGRGQRGRRRGGSDGLPLRLACRADRRFRRCRAPWAAAGQHRSYGFACPPPDRRDDGISQGRQTGGSRRLSAGGATPPAPPSWRGGP